MTEILTVSGVARALSVSEKTVRKWADTGELPARRTDSGQRLFTRVDVDRFRAGQSPRPKAKRP